MTLVYTHSGHMEKQEMEMKWKQDMEKLKLETEMKIAVVLLERFVCCALFPLCIPEFSLPPVFDRFSSRHTNHA